MIKLFEDTSSYISHNVKDGTSYFDVTSSEGMTVKAEWEKGQNKNVVINIHGTDKITLIETGCSDGIKVIYNLDAGVSLDLCIASFEEGNTADYEINMGKESRLKAAFADFSFGKKKYNVVCNLKGNDAYVTWNLASLTTKNDNKTFTVSFNHLARNTFARMENYGVCEDESSLNFLGTCTIIKGAKQTKTHQSAKIMVFDSKCKAKASPVLCIDENDVEASHASVVGQINQDHIYYLMTRGITEEDAKKIITLGYLNPILNYFTADEEILNTIKSSIEKRM